MASHVVVVDTTARKITVKITPEKHLIDILREACEKLGRDTAAYTLKYKNKCLDLSLTFRLSGLPSGARLELILASRSPSVISVALQLPQAEKDGNTRLIDKFASDTTVWKVLRHFEERADGDKRNITGRGVPIMTNQGTGAGQLYYETPVVHILNRDLSSLEDLQRTLAQLGFNKGSALLRLQFKTTDKPLHDAMQQISEFFGPSEGQQKHTIVEREEKGNLGLAKSAVGLSTDSEDQVSETSNKAHETESTNKIVPPPSMDEIARPSSLAHEAGSSRPIIVLAAPTSDTPQAARQGFNESDFVPTIDHAKMHQKRLSTAATNKRLLSDAELAAAAEERRQKFQDVPDVEIKVRFPDQMQVISKFNQDDDSNKLYDFVRTSLEREDLSFSLRVSTSSGPQVLPQGPRGDVKLISGLGLAGRVLVNVVWDDGVDAEARSMPALKAKLRSKAQSIQVAEFQGQAEEDALPVQSPPKPEDAKPKKNGVPKWLKLPGKK